MDLRRVLLFSALAMLGLALLSSASSTPTDKRAEKPAYVPPSAPPPETTAAMPEEERVHVATGTVVNLEVRAEQPDTVEIPELGLDVVVEPGTPAELTFVADRAGRFPVVLQQSGRQVGVLLVTARGPEAVPGTRS